MTKLSTRIIILGCSLLLQLEAVTFHSQAAPGDVDLSFDAGSGVNGEVKAMALQPDGKLIVGGAFTTVKGLARFSLARLNTDGSGDGSFDAGTNADRFITAIAVQADGKVLFTREYINLIGEPQGPKVARLNADGSLDTSFVPALGTFPPAVAFTCMAVQPDGKIVLGGYSAEVDGFGNIRYHSLLIRLGANGALDNTFTNANGSFDLPAGGLIYCLALQPDGKILIAGAIATSVNGTNHYDLIRLNADGTVDPNFNAVEGIIHSVGLQPDGKILLAGYGIGTSTNSNGVARLNADGSIDGTFQPGTDANSSLVSFVVQPDGKVICIGGYLYVNGIDRNGLVRLNSNGSVDAGFNPNTGAPNNATGVIALQSNGKIVIGGGFTLVNGSDRERLARLNSDGSLDGSFAPGSSINASVNSLALQSDGKVIIGGNFIIVGGAQRNRVARLNASGTLDPSFNPGAGPAGAFNAFDVSVVVVAVQSDGKVLVGGDFSSFNGFSRNRLARLNADGTVDTSFVPWVGAPLANYAFQPYRLVVQPDGRILVSGNSALASNSDGTGLVRLNANGSFDTSFHPETTGGDYTVINSVALQPDGKILAGGYFVQSDVPYYLLTRLNANGSRDPNFAEARGGGVIIASVVLQPDGKILVGSGWSDTGDRITRLNTDGSVDNTFNGGSGADNIITSILVQPDGKILVAGFFTSFNGTSRNRIARLNANGSLDTNFNVGAAVVGGVSAAALQPDGNVLIAGGLITADGVVRSGIARLFGDSSSPFSTWAAGFGLTGTSAAATADPDSDGLANGVEFVVGGNPVAPSESAAKRPAVAMSGGYFTFTFSRADASEAAGVTLTVESGTNLMTWPDVFAIGSTTAASSPGVTISENGTSPDLIIVSIPLGAGQTRFARLKVTISP